MNYHDPARAKLGNGYPMYCRPDGSPIAALQFPYIQILDPAENAGNKLIRLTLFLMVDRNSASAFYTTLADCQLDPFLEDFRADPERVMRECFDYQFPVWSSRASPEIDEGAAPVQTATSSISELDL